MSEPVDADDVTRWALQARDGDQTAAAAFIRASQVEVWRCCAALVAPTDADDLTQEVFLRAFRALPSFNATASVRTWLLTIARRVCADHLRSVVRQRRLDSTLQQQAESPSVDGGAASARLTVPDHADHHAVAALLRGLPDDRRVAFALTQVLGLSYAEVAELEGVPVGTIRSRVARARAELLAVVTVAAAA